MEKGDIILEHKRKMKTREGDIDAGFQIKLDGMETPGKDNSFFVRLVFDIPTKHSEIRGIGKFFPVGRYKDRKSPRYTQYNTSYPAQYKGGTYAEAAKKALEAGHEALDRLEKALLERVRAEEKALESFWV